MKLIDADKLIYQSHAQHIQPYINKKDIDNAPTVNAIVIPQNATNGDVIKAMFPKTYVQEILDNSGEVIGYKIWLDGGSQCFMADWWNSPYKECEEE